MAIITYEVCARYFFNAPTVWVFESSAMTNGAASCSPAATRSTRARTCTDIFWDKYSERRKGVIDLVSYLVLFFPTMIFLMVGRPRRHAASFNTGERSQESIWRAIMWPFRAAIPLAALLFMIQGVSESLKCAYQIRFGREFRHRDKLGMTGSSSSAR